jgi:DNA-binding NarL/FixJ family response regulator
MRVVVVDDVLVTRVGVASLVSECGHEVVAQAADPVGALDAVAAFQPDLVVLDIRMPPTHTDEGLVAAREIRSRFPGTAVLVLSQYVETTYALALISETPDHTGYLLKDRVADRSTLADALDRVAAGESYLDPSIVTTLMRRRRNHDPLRDLTQRETEVLAEIAEGRSNAGIAKKLSISERTVETHSTTIFTKLGLIAEPDLNMRVRAVLAWLDRPSDG